MIYKTGLIRKEFQYSYYENKNSMRSLISNGIFQGMLAFSLYFILQTLEKSVIADTAAYLLRESNFSTNIIYLAISYFTCTAYCIIRFREMSFHELYDNSWYSLMHLKYDVRGLVLSKLLVNFIMVYIIYTIGFVVTILLASFLNFPFIVSYTVSQYFLGIFNFVPLLIITMTVSLTTEVVSNARYLIGVSSFFLYLLQYPTGYLEIITDRTAMANPLNLFAPFGPSWYLNIVIILSVVLVLFSILRANKVARRFNQPSIIAAPKLTRKQGLDTEIIVETNSQFQAVIQASKQLEKAYQPKVVHNVLSILTTTVLLIIVGTLLFVDGLMLAFNYASPEKETSVMGFIPYIFQSSTMEPEIMFNDIAFFENVDQFVEINVDDIVLFKNRDNSIQVRRVNDIYIENETGELMLSCNIDYYPADAIKDSLKVETSKESVYGRLVGVNRQLGAIILFANTVFGRILFLLVPTILLFYFNRIKGFFARLNSKSIETEIFDAMDEYEKKNDEE